MKTAIQDLINELKQFRKFPFVDVPTIDAAISFAKLRLEMNKDQIIKAYDEDLYGGLNGHRQFKNGSEYFEQIFNEAT